MISNETINKGLPRHVEALAAILGLLLTAPLLLLTALLIALTSDGPVLFRQERVGRYGRLFTLYKFCTMRVSPDGLQVTAGDDARITGIGRVLRQTKLDELPELWNVLKGDMSLIGPRPEVSSYVDLKNPLWRRVLVARPGITDPVTLSLRNEEALLAEVSIDRERFYLQTLQPFKLRGYLAYFAERSWHSDLLVLWKTALAIVFPRSVTPPDMQQILSAATSSHYSSLS